MVGGNKVSYGGKTSTKTAGLKIIKIHLNSTISTKDAEYTAVVNIRNFNTNLKLDSPEYMQIHLS